MKDRANILSLEMNNSIEIASITSETIVIPAGNAGVVVNCQVKNFPIRDANGGSIGGPGDTSFVPTSTAFDNEVALNTPDTDLANGDYFVNYLTGEMRGKKKDNSVSFTANYKIGLLNISVDDIEVTGSENVSQLGGQAISLAGGAIAAGTQRVTLATDDPAVTALQIIDDWDESDRAKVNLIVGQSGVAAGAGAVGVTVQRVTLASDDPAVTQLVNSNAEYTVKIDTGATYTYIGNAVPGTATSASTWKIKRVTNATGNVDWADSVTTFTKKWDDRATYTYA